MSDPLAQAASSVADANRELSDRYLKGRVLGKGSFGEAFLVKSKADSKKYVAKKVQIGSMNPKDQMHTVMEVRVMQQVSHPNIVGYVDSFLDKAGDLYIIMEYCNGGDLWELVTASKEKGETLPEATVLSYFVQLCLALDYMHRRKILHRDLKARNIFLTRSGLLKIGDFGLSTVLANTFAAARTICGTPYYFSPELCKSAPYTAKSDLWSLGCLLYDMMALSHPFTAANLRALMTVILEGTFPTAPLQKYTPELGVVVSKLLSVEPSERPSILALAQMSFLKKEFSGMAKRLRTSAPGALPAASELRRGSVKDEVDKAQDDLDTRELAAAANAMADQLDDTVSSKPTEPKPLPAVAKIAANPDAKAPASSAVTFCVATKIDEVKRLLCMAVKDPKEADSLFKSLDEAPRLALGAKCALYDKLKTILGSNKDELITEALFGRPTIGK